MAKNERKNTQQKRAIQPGKFTRFMLSFSFKRLKAVATGNTSFVGVLEARLPYTASHKDFSSFSEDSSGGAQLLLYS